ncbi:MAG: diacylglycerol kinase [Pirellulales bacterium]
MARYVRRPRHSFASKLRWALGGVAWGVRTQSNFVIHLAVAAAVVAAGIALRVTLVEWCVLALCTAVVLAAELFNTAIEHLARAITHEHQEEIRHALDTSAAAVLMTSAGAAMVGAAIFVHRLGLLLEWWPGA